VRGLNQNRTPQRGVHRPVQKLDDTLIFAVFRKAKMQASPSTRTILELELIRSYQLQFSTLLACYFQEK